MNPPTMTGKRVLIFAGPDFEDRELHYPYLRFKEEGAEVLVAGLGQKTYKGKHGVPIDVDGNCEDYETQKFDVVIVPGGWAPDKIRMNQAALNIVRNTLKQGNVVAAICHGPWVLTSADVVRGVNVTSYIAIKDDVVHAGGNWRDAEVVCDQRIITSRTPDDLPAFCRAIIEEVSKVPATV